MSCRGVSCHQGRRPCLTPEVCGLTDKPLPDPYELADSALLAILAVCSFICFVIVLVLSASL